jgi:predicted nucleotidyltransferase component of viral defense system
MINKNEISKIATEKQVKTSTIDKDWVLGHFIDAIFSLPECRKYLVFKGGTCLKKCRLPDYRFSEDLDFTSIDDHFVFNLPLLEKIISLIKYRTELPLHIQSIDNLYFNDKLMGYSARIKYWGADHRKDQQLPEPERWLTSIKIEIILFEKICFQTENAKVIHQYSDTLTENANNIPIYSINEVLAEKLRALIQRSYCAPRDYYDIWYLSKNIENIDWDKVIEAFLIKCSFKNLDFLSIEQFINQDNDKILKAAWRNSLSHQIDTNRLPDYETVKNDLWSLFNKIF